MATQQVVFFQTIYTEDHLVEVGTCPSVVACGGSNTSIKLMSLPIITAPCYECVNIVLKIKDSARVLQTCEDVYQKGIFAKLISKVRILDADGCPTNRYQIVASYDDSYLENPELPLQACDIDGYSCFDASDAYLKAILDCINAPGLISVADTDTVDMTIVGGQISSDVRLAPGDEEAPNPIISTVDGLDIDCEKLATRCSNPDTGWSTSNVTTTKSLDADATTLNELSDVVGTLIQTLISEGILSA